MLEITPQERLALLVLCLLLTGGGAARHLLGRAGHDAGLEYSAIAADTSGSASVHALAGRVSAEVAEGRERSRPLGEGERIDPNRASAVELDRLPGIGPALADRIVEYRREHGPFRSLPELGAVQGIGDAMLARVAPLVTLPEGARTRDGPAGGRSAKVDLNRASVEQLQSLPGIGPSIATRIVAFREANGSFQNWEDLEKVSGIGPALRRRLESAARLGP
jgi:competence ComEA-like helix-hairpin-helix protein